MELLKMNGKSRCSAYLRCVSSFAFRVPPAPSVLAKRCDPLTRPAPAGESADSGPRTPARGCLKTQAVASVHDRRFRILNNAHRAALQRTTPSFETACKGRGPARARPEHSDSGRMRGLAIAMTSANLTQMVKLRTSSRLEFLLDVGNDLLAVEAAVLDENLVRIHPGDNDSGQIDAGYVALQSLRVTLGTVRLRIDFHARLAEEVEIRVVAREGKDKIVFRSQYFPAAFPDTNPAGRNLLNLGFKNGADGSFFDAILKVWPDPVLDVPAESSFAVDECDLRAMPEEVQSRGGSRICAPDHGHFPAVIWVRVRIVVRDLGEVLAGDAEQIRQIVIARRENDLDRKSVA